MLVVIGHYPEYKTLAASVGAIAFEVPIAQWREWSDARQWAENVAFLDSAIASRASFLLATPPNEARQDSFYRRELDYLRGRGYRARWNGTNWELRR